MGGMLLSQTVHECIRRRLADAAEPLTARQLAKLVDTTPEQAARALRRLEREGAALCRSGIPNQWTAARP